MNVEDASGPAEPYVGPEGAADLSLSQGTRKSLGESFASRIGYNRS